MTKLSGSSDADDGVLGISQAPGKAGVAGVNEFLGEGGGNGLYGRGSVNGVWGVSLATTAGGGGAGVVGVCDAGNGNGVFGSSVNNDGVFGVTKGNGKAGVVGACETGNCNGVYGRSKEANGVVGFSSSAAHAGVAGTNDNATGVGVYGKGGRVAGFFEGDVEVTGDIRLANADCAEDFDIADAEAVEPGTVMVLDDEGALQQSQRAYDRRVAGVVSGAGNYKPGIVLDKQQSSRNRQPIALLGKVYCKVDAQFGSIGVGDLLTTSPTPGHAMRVDDPLSALGAVIGKALRPLREGQELIPILIALQ